MRACSPQLMRSCRPALDGWLARPKPVEECGKIGRVLAHSWRAFHIMPRYVAIDSNALTYLIDAVQIGYSPDLDPRPVDHERVAMLRCLFYGDCSFWVPPTV